VLRALNLLRQDPHYRREAFTAGLLRAGLEVVPAIANPHPGDVLLIWNRYGHQHAMATQHEANGGTVLVAENCPFGNSWRPGVWYSLARSNPATVGGGLPIGYADRWDAWGVPLLPWRTTHGETLVFGQRSIGNERTASPPGWGERMARRLGARLRNHPGTSTDAVPLANDLANARAAVTWASSAALRALQLGVPVWCDNPLFVAADACAVVPPSGPLGQSLCDDATRLDVFRRLAWGVWELSEIQSGHAIRAVISGQAS
jgi:hypothetical protein